MSSIINFIIKIITLPFTIMSLPFKLIDYVIKIIGILFLVAVIYYFGWIPPLNSFLDTIFPSLGVAVSSIKNTLGVAQNIQNTVNKLPTGTLQKATEYLK